MAALGLGREAFLSALPSIYKIQSIPPLLGSPGYDLPDLHCTISRDTKDISPELINVICLSSSSNVLILPQNFLPSPHLRITFTSKAAGNVLVFGPGASIFGDIKIHGTNSIAIFSGSDRGPAAINLAMSGSGSTFFWGQQSSSNGLSAFVQGDGHSVLIGEDCMVAQRVSLMTTDMHALVDLDTGAWLNDGAPIVIAPHVWLGWESMVMKGTTIGFGSTIAARSVVTRDVPKLTISGGTPNRTLRSEVMWTRSAVPTKSAVSEVYNLAARLGEAMKPLPTQKTY
jgi:serine acetyltransferase